MAIENNALADDFAALGAGDLARLADLPADGAAAGKLVGQEGVQLAPGMRLAIGEKFQHAALRWGGRHGYIPRVCPFDSGAAGGFGGPPGWPGWPGGGA